MAMGGAAILAQFLAQAPDYIQAFDRYEAWLRPHIEYRQKRAIGSAKTFVPSNNLSIALQTAVFRLIGQKIFARLIKQQFAMETVLPDSFQVIDSNSQFRNRHRLKPTANAIKPVQTG